MSTARNADEPPAFGTTSFDCPFCHTRASQKWSPIVLGQFGHDKPIERRTTTAETFDAFKRAFGGDASKKLSDVAHIVKSGDPAIADLGVHTVQGDNVINMAASQCFACKKAAIWCNGHLIWPRVYLAPDAHPKLPEALLSDYREAAAILDSSPRGAAALLRLVVQKLCAILGAKGSNINDDIQSLADKGIDERVRKMLDAVRVIGNSAVHPLQMDIRDDQATVLRLFKVINFIVERTIAEPEMIDDFYGGLPERDLKNIEARAAKSRAKRANTEK